MKKSESNFVVFTYETENEKGENETKYECEIYEGGKKIQETEFKIEEKDGKTEIKFELEKDGKSDGANIKSFAVARKIADILLDGFVNGDYSKLFILYTDMADGGIIIKSTRILPFHTAEFIAEKDKIKEEFEFVPSREVVLDNLVPSYVCGYVYSSLVDSYCVEQNARLVAMKSASDNASSILSDLSREFNHARQNEITTEITEVSSGAKFQRSKKK